MITHLVDSDWLVDYLKGKDNARKLLSPLIETGAVATSVIVCGEILEGLENVAAPDSHRKAFADVLEGIPLLNLDIETAQIFARHRSRLRARGEPIPDHDLWIAATAVRHGLTLLSRDRHFDRIPGLRLHGQS